MNRKNTSKNTKPQRAKSQQNPIPWKYCLLTLVCGLFLVVGFFFAAQQHFSSIDFSIKNSRLKKQIEDLESDKRRMILAKEIALSPAEIKRAAKKIGLTEMTASNIAVFPASFAPTQKSPEKNDDVKSKQVSPGKTVEAKKDENTTAKEIKAEKKMPQTGEKDEKPNTQIARK